MKAKPHTVCTLLAALIATSPMLRAAVPEMIHYQGYVTVSGTPFTGGGLFRFALVDAAGTTTLWSHDGTSAGGAAPTTALNIAVNQGLYSVLLGDPAVPGMTEPVPASVFEDNTDVFLRIWFDDGVNGLQQLAPDTRIASVGYALVAESLVGGSISGAALTPGLTLGGASETGSVTLLADGDQKRVVLKAGESTGRASLRLFDETGTFDTVRLVGAEAGTAGGQLLLKNGSGNTTLEFDAQDGGSTTAGGLIRLNKDDGNHVAKLAADIDNGNSGLLLYDTAGTQETLRMTGAYLGTRGAFLTMKNANGNPTLQFYGQENDDATSASLLRLKRDDGASTVTLRSTFGGEDGGSVQLANSSGNNTVEIAGDAGENQGRILLKHSDLANRVRIDADGPNNSGELKLYDADGTETIHLLAGQSLTSGASLSLKDEDGGTMISLDADDANQAGRVWINSDNGVKTVELVGRETFNGAIRDGLGSRIKLYKSSGTQTVAINSRGEDGEGGEVRLFSNEGDLRAELTADMGDGKSALRMYSPDGATETARFVGSEFGTQGAQILLKNLEGNTTIELDGQGGTSSTDGGLVRLKKNNGTSTIILDADDNGEGKITTEVLQITGGSDLSEQFDIAAQGAFNPQPGMIVCIDSERPGELRLSGQAYDPTVAGIISGAGGVKPGMLMGQHGTVANGRHPVALTGRVFCHVDANYGAVKPGDFITTSATPGHGMKAEPGRAAGAIVGKAMTALTEGRGLVLVLVSLQ